MNKDIKDNTVVADEPVMAELIPEKVKAPVFKTKECSVINYVQSLGILGFDFDGIGCQISIPPNTKIGKKIDIKYTGVIGKDIQFKL